MHVSTTTRYSSETPKHMTQNSITIAIKNALCWHGFVLYTQDTQPCALNDKRDFIRYANQGLRELKHCTFRKDTVKTRGAVVYPRSYRKPVIVVETKNKHKAKDGKVEQ